MSAIGTAASYASDISTLVSGSSDTPSPASASSASPSGTADATSDPTRNPATRVDLSDKIKGILARASTDQDVANRLKAFVEAHRANNSNGTGNTNGNGQSTGSAQDSSSSGQSSTTSVSEAFAQLSGGTQAPDGSQDYAPVDVAKNFATGLKSDGYTISAVARASDGSFQVEIMGPDGKSFLDRRFGTTGEFSSFGGIGAGGSAQSYQQGNKEYITFAQNTAASTSVSASSSAGSVSATSSGTLSDSVTFVVDFSSGSISMVHAESLSVSTAVQINKPGSNFSTVA
jgi:hypothetical protein